MAKVIDISQHRRANKKSERIPIGQTFLLGSLEHVAIGANKRGYALSEDKEVPRYYAIMTDKKALVGSCEFTIENRLVAFSLVDATTGKYLTREVGRHAVSSIALTSLLLDTLATL